MIQTHWQTENSTALQDIFLTYLFTRHAFDSDVEADNPRVRSHLCRSSGRLSSTFGISNFAPFTSFYLNCPSLPVIFCKNVVEHTYLKCLHSFTFANKILAWPFTYSSVIFVPKCQLFTQWWHSIKMWTDTWNIYQFFLFCSIYSAIYIIYIYINYHKPNSTYNTRY